MEYIPYIEYIQVKKNVMSYTIWRIYNNGNQQTKNNSNLSPETIPQP